MKNHAKDFLKDSGQPPAAKTTAANNALFGMWLFLAMEMLFFGAFFMIFGASYHQHAVDFKVASHHLNRAIAITNTIFLLTSSLSMAIAVELSKIKSARALRPWLALTVFFGLAFLVLKVFEYKLDAQDGILPFIHYAPTFEVGASAYLFYSLYFFITAIHFIHLSIGCGWVATLAFSKSTGGVELSGLYWHFVDVIWIFLLPTLYLLQ